MSTMTPTDRLMARVLVRVIDRGRGRASNPAILDSAEEIVRVESERALDRSFDRIVRLLHAEEERDLVEKMREIDDSTNEDEERAQ